MIDGIARSGKRVLFKYPSLGEKKAAVRKNPALGTGWARSFLSAGQGSLMYYDPYYDDKTPLLFENISTDKRDGFAIDWEEVLSHELFHVWAYSNDDGIVKIGEPSYQEARRRLVPEGYAIRYINKLRKQRGSQWIRIVYNAYGEAVILDGKKHGNVIRR